MPTTTPPDPAAAGRAFLEREGRVLERRLHAALVDGAAPGGALAALRAYRNPDGGIGHGLEPDKLCPDSQPIDDQHALQVMDELGTVDDDLARGICDHLASVAEDGAVPLATPAIEGYPRAAHWAAWTYVPSLNPTAGIVGTLHRLGVTHTWRDAAEAWCWAALERDGLPGDAHALLNVTTFLAAVEDRDRADAVAAGIGDHLPAVEHLRLDPHDPAYGMTPLHYAPTPGSPWTALFGADLIAAHLDRLLRDRADDGGWTLTWEPPSVAATLAYRGIETLRALRALRAWGRA